MQTMVQMLRVMLAKEMSKGGMGEDEYKDLVTPLSEPQSSTLSYQHTPNHPK